MNALACCVVLLVAWLTFVLTASNAMPKALRWVRRRLHVVRRFMGLFLARGSPGGPAHAIRNRETVAKELRLPHTTWPRMKRPGSGSNS